jgi:hypothetical protein
MILTATAILLAGDREDLAAAAKKTAELKSYKFTADIEAQGGPGGGQPFSVEGFHRKEDGTYAKVGDRFEVARKGDRVAYADQSGEWKPFEDVQGRARGFVKEIKSPHEELPTIDKKFDKLAKDEKCERYDDGDCAVYSGTLSDEGARALVPMGDQLKKWGDPTVKGTARIYVNSDGAVVRYVIDVELTFDFNGNSFPVAVSRDVKLSRLDNVQDDLPSAAKEILEKEIPSEDKKE